MVLLLKNWPQLDTFKRVWSKSVEEMDFGVFCDRLVAFAPDLTKEMDKQTVDWNKQTDRKEILKKDSHMKRWERKKDRVTNQQTQIKY